MLSFILLQAAADGGSSPWNSSLFLLVAVFAVFYFTAILPNQQRTKKQKKFVSELRKGDKVVTNSGLHGRIFEINENTIVIDVDKGLKLTFTKSAVSLDASKALSQPAKK